MSVLLNLGDKIIVGATVQATGGTETVIEQDDKFYRVHSFLSNGNLTVSRGGQVEYLVVAGGGGGSGRDVGGGGGAGGYRCSVQGEMSGGGVLAEPLLAIAAQAYPVVVGAGGIGQVDSGSASDMQGGNSSFAGIVAVGGGAGKVYDRLVPNNGLGGSGGGASGLVGGTAPADNLTGGLGTAGQGFNGGTPGLGVSETAYGGTGGGGAGGAGLNAASGRHGGIGVQSSITGVSVFRAGGGGGAGHRGVGNGTVGNGGLGGGGNAADNASRAVRDGAPNTGGGGGASRNTGQQGGNGGSGIVIVRYRITQAEYDAEVA